MYYSRNIDKIAHIHIPTCFSRAREVDKVESVKNYDQIVEMRKQNLTHITDHAEVSEKSIERYLVEKAKEHGLPCLKYSNPNMVGYPDRLLVLPGAKVIWVELKSRGRKPDKRQLIRHAELSGMGHEVRVIDNKADIDELLNSIVK